GIGDRSWRASPRDRLGHNILFATISSRSSGLSTACPQILGSRRAMREVDAAHVREGAAAISNLGFCHPVFIDEQDRVLDGVIRVEAAKLLGLPRIPCIRANHLSTSECRLVRMALNRIGEKGSWNFDQLKLELQELILEEAPIEITGFS